MKWTALKERKPKWRFAILPHACHAQTLSDDHWFWLEHGIRRWDKGYGDFFSHRKWVCETCWKKGHEEKKI